MSSLDRSGKRPVYSPPGRNQEEPAMTVCTFHVCNVKHLDTRHDRLITQTKHFIKQHIGKRQSANIHWI